MILKTQAYKGMRDFFPEDKLLQNYIFDSWRQTVLSFGFLEYGTPLLEPLEIYAAKSGDELVGEQTYQFEDRGGRQVAIRPEMTPSVSRLVAARRQELAQPARLFSIANFLRYERPQKGREREFWQLNADIFGEKSSASDAEILQLANQLLLNLGATPDMYCIYLNHRGLINFLTNDFLQLNPESSARLTRLIDKKTKMSSQAFDAALADIMPEQTKIEQLQQFLNTTNFADLPAAFKATSAAAELSSLLDLLEKIGVAVKFEPSLMRGLDYYTGMVFEIFDNDPANNRALFGGGRYDGLVEMFGADPISAVGFAPGLTTMEVFLKSRNLVPNFKDQLDYYLICLDEFYAEGLQLAAVLRSRGYRVEVDTTERKLAAKIKTAVKKAAAKMIILGEDEVNHNLLTIKDLKTGAQQKIAPDEIPQI